MGERLEQTIQVVEQLEAALHEGRALLKDLKYERKQAEKLKADLQDLVKKVIETNLQEALDAAVETEMKNLVAGIHQAQEEGVDTIVSRFDEVANMLMYGNAQGRGDNLLVELARKRRQK